MTKYFLLFLSSFAIAQTGPTAAIPAMTVPIPSRIVPSQTIHVVVPKGCSGCTISVVIPQQSLVSQVTKTPATTAPVALGMITLNFSCTGSDLQHLTCKAAQQ
jgi:hypothetical protein